jgi:uncharacterized protein (TIGR02598 family)
MRTRFTNSVILRRLLPPDSWLLTSSRSAFSLVEVTLALAIMAIGLIAIIGMIPQGVQSSRDAADNTLAATIVHDTFNQLRQEAVTTWPPPSLATSPNLYYDVVATNATTSQTVDSYYHVHLTSLPGTVAGLPAPNLLLVVTAVVSWPTKSAAPLNNITNVTQIANYQQ